MPAAQISRRATARARSFRAGRLPRMRSVSPHYSPLQQVPTPARVHIRPLRLSKPPLSDSSSPARVERTSPAIFSSLQLFLSFSLPVYPLSPPSTFSSPNRSPISERQHEQSGLLPRLHNSTVTPGCVVHIKDARATHGGVTVLRCSRRVTRLDERNAIVSNLCCKESTGKSGIYANVRITYLILYAAVGHQTHF